MTIDETDYSPRPADDFIAFMSVNSLEESAMLRDRFAFDFSGIKSFALLATKKPKDCHQLGCDFSELPHAI